MNHLSLAIEAIKERRTRSILTILMVVVGAGLLIAINGFTNGILTAAENNLNQLAPNIMFVSPAVPAQSGPIGNQGPPPTPKIVFNSIIVEKIRSLPNVVDAIPSYRGSVTVESGSKRVSASVIAYDPTKIFVIAPNIKLEEGSILSNDRGVIVLGSNIANPPGESVRFANIGQAVIVRYQYIDEDGSSKTNTKSLIVKAILKPTGNPTVDNAVLINPDVGNTLLNKGGKYDNIIVVARNKDLVDSVESNLRKLYGNDIGISSARAILDTIRSFNSSINSFLSAIAVMALVVASVGIITTLYTSVVERTREIGILKAIGAENRYIMLIFLFEALIIGVIGATIAIPIGIGGGYLLTNLSAIIFRSENSSIPTPVYEMEALTSVWILAVLLSITAGLYPAYKASRLDPVVALGRS